MNKTASLKDANDSNGYEGSYDGQDGQGEGSYYEDESGSQQLKLRDAKKERQRVEENAMKLENRVQLLEKEKMRVMKKIEEVKKKALEIMKIKQRNQEEEQARQEFEDRRREDLQTRQLKIQEMKAEHEERLNTSKFNSMSNSLVIAKTTKESLKVKSSGA